MVKTDVGRARRFPDYVAPDGARGFDCVEFYKYAAPTVLKPRFRELRWSDFYVT